MTVTVPTMVAMVLVKRSGLESGSKTVCIVRRRVVGAIWRAPNSLAFGGPRLQETLQRVDLEFNTFVCNRYSAKADSIPAARSRNR